MMCNKFHCIRVIKHTTFTLIARREINRECGGKLNHTLQQTIKIS